MYTVTDRMNDIILKYPYDNVVRVAINKVKSKGPFIYFNHYDILNYKML